VLLKVSSDIPQSNNPNEGRSVQLVFALAPIILMVLFSGKNGNGILLIAVMNLHVTFLIANYAKKVYIQF
jgi:hypothetical protein